MDMADNSTAIEIEATEMGPAEPTCMDPRLYNAAFEGNIDAFPQGVEPVQQLLTQNKNTVLHIHFTAETGNVSEEFVKHILKLCPAIPLQANAKGETPLHIAARYGRFAAVNILMEHSRTIHEDLEGGLAANKKLVRATNIVGDSTLHEAVRYKHIEVVKLLIKEDADYPYFANEDGETPLYIAVGRYYKEIVFEILQNCKSPAYGGPNGRTALHSAVLHRDEDFALEMVKGLLDKEHLKSSIREPDELGCLPLHLAAKNGYANLTKMLLEKDRKTAYMRDKEGRTALHLAVRKGDRGIIEMILSECPDSAEIADNNGQNALHYALSNKFYVNPVANIIIKKTSLSNLYNEKDADGNTPLHLFSSRHHASSEYDEVLKFIEHHRVDKLAFNKQNRTAYDENHTAYDNYLREDRKFEAKRSLEIEKKLDKYGAWKIEGQRKQTPVKKEDNDDDSKDSRNINKNDEDEDLLVKRAKDSHLVVATLIATVTFAAGFTLPGGSFQEGEHQGTPILKHNAAFQAFLVTDTIAMVLSTTAVLIHMFLVLYETVSTRTILLFVAFFMTMTAMASMMIAFVTGIVAVMGVSSGLGTFIILIGVTPAFDIVIFIILSIGSPVLIFLMLTCHLKRTIYS